MPESPGTPGAAPRFQRLRSALAHAFAVKSGADALSPSQLEVADQLASAIRRRGLALPALLWLETFRPLNYLAAQALHGLTPLVGSLVGTERVRGLAEFLEARGSIDAVCQRLEAAEPACAAGESSPPAPPTV